jgi:hypothetical protein
VVDGQRVITGSFNWSPSAAHQNDETLLVIDSPILAGHFTAEINRLWRGAELGVSASLARKQAWQRALCRSGIQRGLDEASEGVQIAPAILRQALASRQHHSSQKCLDRTHRAAPPRRGGVPSKFWARVAGLNTLQSNQNLLAALCKHRISTEIPCDTGVARHKSSTENAS